MLVPFPFTDLSGSRVRPAVVVTGEPYEAETGDLIVAMVTSQPYAGRTDYALEDWAQAGLVYPSWLRAKLATLERRVILYSPGRVTDRDSAGIDRVLRLAMELP